MSLDDKRLLTIIVARLKRGGCALRRDIPSSTQITPRGGVVVPSSQLAAATTVLPMVLPQVPTSQEEFGGVTDATKGEVT